MMDSRSLSLEVSQLVHHLAALPGSVLLDVLERSYPRFGPAEPGTRFRQYNHRFTRHDLPPALEVPDSVEEIVITVNGAVSSEDQRRILADAIEQIKSTEELGGRWDMRSWFAGPDGKQYTLQIFTQASDPPTQWD